MTGRILIADGQATNRITLKVRLAAACYHATTASDMAQLVALARERRPELIVLGGDMPGHDIPTACGLLRAADDLAGIPVLALCRAAQRLPAMRAGASAVLDAAADELMLLARIRGLLRDTVGTEPGFAEPAAAFSPAPAEAAPRVPRVVLVGDGPARALSWKHALSRHLPYRFAICDTEQALAEVAAGAAADLYLIAANLDAPGEGLRLLSELRSRPASRDSAFLIAVPDARPDLAAIALDLGAGDTVSTELAQPALIELTAIALGDQIARKGLADRRRAEAQQRMLWSITDPLTGLFNRRYALPRLTEALRSALGRGGGCALLAIDADHFKRINDRHGHAAGDRVLAEIARRLETAVGARGLVARMGGEEFVALLPGARAEAAADCAEAIRAAMAADPVALPVLAGGGVVPVTVSIGLACIEPTDARLQPEAAAELMLHRADAALRAAKTAGRNQIRIAA